ncbi:MULTISPECIES: type VII secretion protein EccCa [unclassified Streptomyces]|uniref:type VII secretion protein EccCa n=1 Tax=unclassified Streptomyces TaxID=2593676 RepID=UPI00081BA0DF|nr:type VII secretion protein EccCa [Streptomyces sp. DvalAA-43]MYQ86775.1 type VII secretion protein EccCa [Streptomyces sp. SID4936]SCE33625.1 DNA segregation ATPase FtsK/SpoIIIE, S-DNA-T family [Streptomyces sp. DvalAA-43]
MSRIPFHRPVRMTPPPVPEGGTTLAAPPQRPQPQGAAGWLMLLLPLLSSVSMAAYMVAYGRAWMILLGMAFVVVSIGITIGVRMQLRGSRRRNQFRQRERYMEYLSGMRKQALHSRAEQRAADAWRHPHPDRLWALATRRRRVWERRPGDDDFLRLRLGTGTVPPAAPLRLPEQSDPTVELDTACRHAAVELVGQHAAVDDQAAWLDLGNSGVVSLLGPRARGRELAQALLLQLSVLHAPDDVRVAVVTGGHSAWDWAKWLPHAQPAEQEGGAREQEVVPMLADDLTGLNDHLRAVLDQAVTARAERGNRLLTQRGAAARRHLVVFIDDYEPEAVWARSALLNELLTEAGPEIGLHLVCLVDEEGSEPGRVDVRARTNARGGLVLQGRDPVLHASVEKASADEIAPGVLEAAARALAPLQLSGEREQVLSAHVSLSGMLGIPDIASFDPADRRRAPDDRDLLSVPIGVTGTGEPLVLDVKESAQGGVGPHGLVVGATGSGKSELLRTLVTGLALVHSPEHLAFVLVDFKGGATFAGVTELPHVSGLITNLADDLALVDRMRQALQGEQQRRQRMLREAGNADSVREYQLRQAAGGTDSEGRPLEPLPYLLIVVDEFGELLSQRPDFIDLFVQIGRVGRSLGMHLLLATQRLEEGRLRGLESHLSYRIGLRTFSAAESRAVLGTPDAYSLPAIPGSAYLKVDETVYERFRVAHVSAPYRGFDPDASPAALAPVPFAVHGELAPLAPEEEEKPAWEWTGTGGTTELALAVERVLTKDTPGHQVWLPPLPAHFGLLPLLGEPEEDPERGLVGPLWPLPGSLKFPAGVIDVPARQEQRPIGIDLTGRQGHLALVGAPQSGKSTFLRTAMLSAMLTHTPDELQFYAIDMGGGTLHGLADAPHVAGIAGRRDEERVRRVLAEVGRIVTARETMFRDLRIQSAADLRARRVSGELPEGVRAADVVLVVDNWAALHAAEDEAAATLTDIAARGLGVGVHLWLTANRWAEIRVGLRDSIPGRLELRLNDPAESEINRQAARALGQSVPGRGILPPGLTHHVALPRLDGVDSVDGLAEAERELVARIAASWKRPSAPALRVLPQRVTVRELAAAAVPAPAEHWEGHGPALTGREVPIGLRESDLTPVGLDLTSGEPHFVVLGDSGSGKTAFLRAWMRGLAARHSARDARFMVVDYRHSLLDVVPPEYIGARGGNADLVAGQAQALVETLRSRMPPPDVTATELAGRTWWQGPELYVVADDYDLATGGMGQGPLAPLAPFIPQAEELGFHLVLARRVGGAGRALLSDPLLSKLKENGTSGLLLSGDHREGVLIGEQRARRGEPGRGLLVRRGQGPTVVQIALDERDLPEEAAGDPAAAPREDGPPHHEPVAARS